MKQFIANLMTGFGIADVIDILIVAFIAYEVITFIAKNRAQQLVRGILLLFGVYLLSNLLKLYTLNWILKNTLTIGLVALIILFQPELRRGLEYMGRGAIRKNGRIDKTSAKYVVDEIVKAVDSFSESRTGALMVVEQLDSLGDIIETGTVIDADISSEMLGNIFYKGAPLHDGAAILRDNKVYAAGCVLPLTSDLSLSKELGTRHRAGIGITEHTDAVSIIVSEENGVISVARDGRLTRFLDSKGIEKYLLNIYLKPEEEEKNPIIRFLKKRKNKNGGEKDAK
ncbi:MAG: diadenylate cyclase CdaA [Eubacterium sp.]|jgi:diadenylate cyclase